MLEKLVYNLIHQKKFKIYVVTLQSNNEYIAQRLLGNGVNVIPLDFKTRSLLKGFFNLYNFLKKIKPKQFHGWMYHGNLIAFIASLFYRRSILYFNVRQALHSIKQEKFLTRIVILCNAFLSNKCKYIIYNTRSGIQHHESIGFSFSNSYYIPNGIDTNTYIPCRMKRSLFRNKLRIKDKTKLVCMLARYDPIKGHKLFLEAAIKLTSLESNVLFILAGHGLNTLYSKYNTLINRLGNKLLIMEHQNDVPELLNGIDILTICSVSEGFPNVLGEAMSVGTICLSSNAGDARYIIGDEANIYFKYTPQNLAENWLNIFNKTEIELKQISSIARSRIVSQFSEETFFNSYNKLLDEL